MSIYTRTSLVLTAKTPPPTVRVDAHQAQSPTGTVRLDGGSLSIQSSTPAYLMLLAEAFTDCARQLAAAADTYGAQTGGGSGYFSTSGAGA